MYEGKTYQELRTMAERDSGRGWCKALLDVGAPSLEQLCRQSGIKLAPKSEQFYFRRVAPESVPSLTHLRATKVGALCAERLNLPDLRLKWIDPVSDPALADYSHDKDVWGLFSETETNTIFVRADVPEDDITFVVGHEARHAWQRAGVEGFDYNDPKHEEDANSFAAAIVAGIQQGYR
ncbi:MAG: hypothetical protein Q7O66_23665 [Dehalococcoidia bacterium]|nr:hypothetical protein [Dehalococcoidia bacterium]